MLVIHDEQLAKRLQEIAANENRPVEDVLKALVEHYPQTKTGSTDTVDMVKRVRQKAYSNARRYWEEIGNTERLQLTDEELDEQFWLFDSDGIPRLKSEQNSVTLKPGTGAWIAESARKHAFKTENPIDPEQADDILNAEFADYLPKRMQNGASTNSD